MTSLLSSMHRKDEHLEVLRDETLMLLQKVEEDKQTSSISQSPEVSQRMAQVISMKTIFRLSNSIQIRRILTSCTIKLETHRIVRTASRSAK